MDLQNLKKCNNDFLRITSYDRSFGCLFYTIHNAILFIDTLTMFDSDSSFFNWETMFGDLRSSKKKSSSKPWTSKHKIVSALNEQFYFFFKCTDMTPDDAPSIGNF